MTRWVSEDDHKEPKVGCLTFLLMVVFFFFCPWRTLAMISSGLLAARSYRRDNDA